MEYIILIVVLAVLLVGVGGTLLLRPLVGRRRDRGQLGGDTTGSGTDTGADTGTAGTGTESAAAPSRASTATVAPPAAEPASAPEKPRPSIEKPPPSAGRLVRLRARLARSQSGFGGALLNLLSRDHLDDDAWDEIEEILITADVGVTPARQIVEDL
jgi:fused signal recognition particle receptor